MTLRSCVFLWTLLLPCSALPGDSQACGNNCSTEVVLNTTTTTSVTLLSPQKCNVSSGGQTSINGSITGLNPGVVHVIQVHCLNCCREVATQPERVLNLDATSTTSSILVTWTEPPGEISSYRINWTHGDGADSVGTTETWNITGLTAGTQYDVTVTAVAQDGRTEGEGSTLRRYTKPNMVESLNVKGKTTSSIYLNWAKPEGNNSFYRVKWTDGFHTWNDSVTETSINVTRLTPGVNYSLTVQSVAGDNKTDSDVTQISSYTRPGIVLNLNLTEITTSSIYLNWTKPEGNNSFYRVKWTDGFYTWNDSVTETSINVTKLTPGVNYSLTVQSVAEDNRTDSDVTQISSYTRPGIVLNLTVAAVTTSSILLTWNQPEGNNSFYRVKWTDGLYIGNDSVAETSINVTKLTPGVNYSLTVQSVAGDNRTDSDVMQISSYTRPGIVLNLNLTEITTSSIYLNWTKPEGNNSFYRVKWTDGFYTWNDSVAETSINVTKLTPGVNYSLTVQSVAGDNRTDSDVTQISSYTKPDRPGNVTATWRGTTSLTVTWTHSGGKTFFTVDVSNDRLAYRNVSRTAGTSANVTGLAPGKVFNVTVTAVAGSLEHASDVFLFATLPTPPGDVHVAARTNSSIRLTWSGAEGMDGAPGIRYNVAYRQQGGETQSKDTTDSNTELSSLLSGTNYSIDITTVGPQNLSSTPEKISSFTLPNAVLNLVASADSTTSVVVSWSAPPGVRPYYRYSVDVFNATAALVKSTTVADSGTRVSELDPGSRYQIRVTTVAAPGINSTAEEAFSCTKPSPVADLGVERVNATYVQLRWRRQKDHQPATVYQVEAFRDGLMVQNGSTQAETYAFHSLNPGTLYKFQVFAVLEGVPSSKEHVLNYTEPEAVCCITVTGGTTDLTVSWDLVSGQVSSYTVQLSRGGNPQNSTHLSSDTTSIQFTGLKPGAEYCAVLVTKSGPHAIPSVSVCNATFPNPPGPVTVQSQTVTSINFTWAPPLNMDPGQFSFSVTVVNGSFPNADSWFLLDDLQSGSPYNFSVVTVGAMQYESAEQTALSYTRPYPVTDLRETNVTTDTVTLEWSQLEAKWHYLYSVWVSNKSEDNPRTVSSPNITITGLQSGSNFNFTVTTRTADGTEAEPATASYFTRPHPVQQLVAQTLNTTAVHLSWSNPPQYKDYYRYSVEVTGCSYQKKNLSEETVEISGLDPGTNCTFCVSVEAGGLMGERFCTSAYTEPETVRPTMSAQSNDSIRVSWSRPEGNVEKYQVNLSRLDSPGWMQLRSVDLNGDSTDCLFENLSAGRRYSAVVVARSGPFSAASDPQENATFPNPPGPITILTKTTGSIHFSWTEAPFMEDAQFIYQVTLVQLPEGTVTNISSETTAAAFDSLPSGTPFTISVSTVGRLHFESLKVYENVTTRPLSVQSLTTAAGDALVRVDWMKPDDYKDGYRYNLTWEGPDGASSIIVNNTTYTLVELDPGSHYNVSVTTETFDGTQAEPRRSSNCTRASPVKSATCGGPNEDDAQINLSWLKPDGRNSGFRVSVSDTEIQNNATCCSHNIPNLRHNTEYEIAVETLSCGRASPPEVLRCTTGITNPPIPSDYRLKVQTEVQGHNKFSVRINSTLFDPAKGPITHVGLLVTKTLSGPCSDCRKYLLKTYDDFKDGTAQVYLATVAELQQSRSSRELSLHVGNDAQWEGYPNGALEAKTKYQCAVVLFTRLTMRNRLVDGGKSLASFTDFVFDATLSVDPVVIGTAVGSTLGIFFVLFIVLIGFVIFWRRMSKKESPEIQIQSLRAKVNAPVRVEEYEAYFRKQKADSNCGFAEEFEDLKPVGTAQAKIHALFVENKPKNRYTNVLPYDSSRVKLSIIRGSPSDDYINANYIPGYNSRKEFIAAQGPLPATVNDFWRMIWEKNAQTLVMLTRCNEQGRIKCEQYWSPATKHFGNITVTTASEIPLEDWTIRDFTIKNVKTAETRSVRHFHFTAWPDHGVPETTELLIGFRHLVREHMNQYSRHSPTVVHCSAGVGRTGTFIAVDHLIFQIERENIVDVYGVVHELRMHRALMVQTEDQYVFLNQCALDIIRSRTGTNVDLIYQNVAALSIYENLEPHRSFSKNSKRDT